MINNSWCDCGNVHVLLLGDAHHISYLTYAPQTQDHCYSPFRNGYKALSRTPFGKSDHASKLLFPIYRQKLKQEASVVRTIQHWADQSESFLQDWFGQADWEMFWVTSENSINVYTDLVTLFKCIEDVVPTVTIRTYPSQNPGYIAAFAQNRKREPPHLTMASWLGTWTCTNRPATTSIRQSKR